MVLSFSVKASSVFFRRRISLGENRDISASSLERLLVLSISSTINSPVVTSITAIPIFSMLVARERMKLLVLGLSSAVSMTVPGVTTLTTSRLTIFLVFLGSSTWSHMATLN